MGQKSHTNQPNEARMGDSTTKTIGFLNFGNDYCLQTKYQKIKKSKVCKLDYLGHNVCKIMPHGNQYILMMYTSNMGHASVVVDKSHLLGLADFINKAMEEK